MISFYSLIKASKIRLMLISRIYINMEEAYEIQLISNDEYLRSLFAPLQAKNRQQQLKQQPSFTQQPSRYDPRDIDKDYLSECPPRKRISKAKKRKFITNRTLKVRRQRKNKLYIEMLENRIFELQREIQVLRRANTANKRTLKKNNDAEHIVNGFFLNKQRHYQKLNTLAKQADIDQQRFMEEYGMLRLRQGAVGRDRIKVINYYFRELSEIMIPDLHKYILKTAEEESDLFDPNYLSSGALGSSVEQWRKDLIFDLQLSHEKIFSLSQLRQDILRQKSQMHRFFQQIYQSKCKIQQSSRRMQKIFDRLQNIFSPRDIAKCLCLIEKYKFEKGFSIADVYRSPFCSLEEEQKDFYDPEHLYQSK